jgi:peptide-methionine (S)-S-oxide reductase
MTKSIVLGGGCFWCTEAVFQRVKGVTKVESGYAGGNVSSPSYEQVVLEDTGHVEVVKVDYDDSVITLSNIIEIFLKTHDPTTLNRQGNDVGPQYRSVIFVSNEEETNIANEVIKKVSDEEVYKDPIVTSVETLDTFYPAEEYHQNYFNQNSNQSYCRIVIDPKVKKFLDQFKEFSV